MTKVKDEKKDSSDEWEENKAGGDLRRSTYLRSKGVKPGAQQFQLDFVFPDTIGQRTDLRHLAHDLGRGALFSTKDKRVPRKSLMRQKLFHYNQHVSLLYTGVELRAEDDELIWLQIMNYGQSTPMGEPFVFTIRDLVRDVGWSKSGPNYDRARMSISRLKANEILLLNSKAYGKSGAMSMIQNYETDNDDEGKATQYKVWIDQKMMLLFAGNQFSSHKWDVYITLSPVARRLADYIESHKQPFPLALDTFQQMCSATTEDKHDWKKNVRRACKEVVDKGIVTAAIIPARAWRIDFVQEKSDKDFSGSNNTRNGKSSGDSGDA